MDNEQRRSLYRAKLGALATDNFGVVGDLVDLPFGAVVVGSKIDVDGSERSFAVAYLADEPRDHLGAVLALIVRRNAGQLAVLVDDPAAAAVLARQATRLRLPTQVHRIVDRSVELADPIDHADVVAPIDGVDDLIAIIREAGLDLVVEHGEVTGELLGLELARIVVLDGEPVLDVGVGKFDQEAGAMLRGATPAAQSLHEAVAQISEIRSADGPAAHGLNRVARERWLRAAVLADPESIDVASLEPVEPLYRRAGVIASMPAAAITQDGTLVVCSLGADVEVVAHSADLLVRHSASSLVHVVPEDKAMPIIGVLLDLLDVPVRTLAVPPPWPL